MATTKRTRNPIFSTLWEVTATELLGVARQHFHVVATTPEAALMKVAPLVDKDWRVTAANYLGEVRSDLMNFR